MTSRTSLDKVFKKSQTNTSQKLKSSSPTRQAEAPS
jgi:hypothetical protein